jgi:two-component system chemotaxis sensor kinase CheA
MWEPMVNLEEYKDMFLSETSEHLQMLNDNLLKIEKDPSDMEALKDVFRSTHTIKGMAATMGYEDITKVSHEMESALDPYRKNKLPLTPDMVQMTFEGLDLLERLKDSVKENKIGQIPIADYLSKLDAAKKKGPKAPGAAPKKEAPSAQPARPPAQPAPVSQPATPPPQATPATADYPQEVLKDEPISPEVMEYLEMFMSEASEHLQSLNENMLKLEADPADFEALASVFRSSHTIKGMAATMSFNNMSKLTHEMETALDFYRKTKFPLDHEIINATFECLDKLEKLNDEVKSGKTGGIGTRNEIIKLRRIIDRNGPWQDALKRKEEGVKAGVTQPTAPTKFAVAPPVETKPMETGPAPALTGGAPLEAPGEKREDVKSAAEDKALKGGASIRISIENLENLMNLVGELVINKSRLVQIGKTYELHDLNDALGQIDRLTTELQDEVLKMRMVPTRYIFNRFPRMVRDLAMAEGKEVEFIVTGWDIELDRTVLDEISEPLVHLLRNAIDHGIEKTEDREKVGKGKVGTIKLTAVREKNYVTISVEDDGKGVDPEVIKRKAVEKGLMDAAKAQTLTQEECVALLFMPGFSTAQKVTAVSGRGVGMDIVKTKTESLGGRAEMISEKGKGAKTVLTLPLTMAIIRALLVRIGQETYALPISLVLETGRYQRSKLKTVQGKEVIILRDEVVPLIKLKEIFGIEKALEEEDLTVVFVEKGDKRLGLVVDYLIGQQEIVIKPLGKIFQNIRGVAGATILGDGRVALILDVATLV